MKNLKLALAVIALSIVTVMPASANTNVDPTNPTTTEAKTILRTEIATLLGKHVYDLNESLEAQVSIMLNNQNQLVVVAVKSKNTNVSNFVKTKLNYKKVDVKGIQKGIVYRVPLKMAQSS